MQRYIGDVGEKRGEVSCQGWVHGVSGDDEREGGEGRVFV